MGVTLSTSGRRRQPPRTPDPWEVHRDLAKEAGRVLRAAEALDGAPIPGVRREIDGAYEFLSDRFLPNAREEQAIRVRLAHRDCRTVQLDRVTGEIEGLVAHLAKEKALFAKADTPAARRDLRKTLYLLASLLDLHYAL